MAVEFVVDLHCSSYSAEYFDVVSVYCKDMHRVVSGVLHDAFLLVGERVDAIIDADAPVSMRYIGWFHRRRLWTCGCGLIREVGSEVKQICPTCWRFPKSC